MNSRPLFAGAVLACIATFSLAAPSPGPQQQPSVVAHPKVDAGDKVYSLDQIVTASVHDAWMLSGKNEAPPSSTSSNNLLSYPRKSAASASLTTPLPASAWARSSSNSRAPTAISSSTSSSTRQSARLAPKPLGSSKEIKTSRRLSDKPRTRYRLEAPAQQQGGWMPKLFGGFQVAGDFFLLTTITFL